MRIYQETNEKEVEVIGEEGKMLEVGIDMKNIGIFFEMMSSGIYSNPFGSIIRELTSNCYDSHVEARVDDAVVVGYKYIEEDVYLFFEDVGVGLSPERFENIFLNYLSSTKRDNNDEHGGFGIGSKSPLSYTDCFYVETRFNGIEYLYAITKNMNSKPNCDVIYEKPTYHRNGTEVRFIINGGYYSQDWKKFEKEIKTQLRYFDNVYVQGFSVNNNYKIYEFDTFKFRPDIEETEMHIVLGRVTYPINWKSLNRERINIPVGVKFNIGELLVTSNREQIRYEDFVIEVINKKINATIQELKSLSRFEFTDLNEFLTWKEQSVVNIVTKICTIPVYEGNYGTDRKGEIKRYPFSVDGGYFKPLGNLPIEVPKKNPFFFLQLKGTLSNGSYSAFKEDVYQKKRRRRGDGIDYQNVWEIIKKGGKIYRDADFKPNRIRNAYFQNGFIVVKKKLRLKDWMIMLGMTNVAKSPFSGKLKGVPLITEDGFNKLKLIKHYRKIMMQEFMSLSDHYSKIEIPADFVADFKASTSKKTFLIEGEIAAYDFTDDSKTKVPMLHTDLNKGFVIYGATKSIYDTIKSKDYLKALTQVVQRRYRGKIFKVIGVNLNEMEFIKGDNKITLHEYVTKSKVFREQVTALHIYNQYREIDIDYLLPYMPAVEKQYKELKEFMSKTVGDGYIGRLLDNKF